ncbi:MAG TPA: response regulator [Tepidisphaeraceae bacterium]|nr:response regulator [Tepidisphaeraceae bacterium]
MTLLPHSHGESHVDPSSREDAPSRPARAPAPQADHPLARAQCRRTLIVEDERRLREMLHTSIREMGFEPTVAASAEAALRLLADASFAVAVLDLNLPGMGGIELAEALRKRWPFMQIIILTGFGDLDAARRAIHLDVADFLTKPCGMNELEQAHCRAQTRWLTAWAAQHAAEAPAPQQEQDPSPKIHPEEASVNADSGGGGPPVVSLEEMERHLILAALERRHGNREAAAADLGISLRKLYYRLQQYQQAGLMPREWEEEG